MPIHRVFFPRVLEGDPKVRLNKLGGPAIEVGQIVNVHHVCSVIPASLRNHHQVFVESSHFRWSKRPQTATLILLKQVTLRMPGISFRFRPQEDSR